MNIRSVDAFFGVSPRGNCLVGPYRPFSLVRLGPDVGFPYRDRSTDQYSTSGYIRGQPVVRFSHTHVAGTGGTARYGNIALTPFSGPPRAFDLPPFWAPPAPQARFEVEPGSERAAPGYYTLTYARSGIQVELTSTPRVGVHRYTYPAGEPAWILLDAASAVQPGLVVPGQAYAATDWDTGPASIGGWIEVLSEREIWGCAGLRGGWGHDEPYTVFFYLLADRPFARLALANAAAQAWPDPVAGQVRADPLPGRPLPQVRGPGCRALIGFDQGGEINLRVGISFRSAAQARAAVEREVGDKTFDQVRREAEDDWNRLLGRFEVEGGSAADRERFASCLYRICCMPTYLGRDENPFPGSAVGAFTDFYCLWDSVRNANSFFHLFTPAFSAQMMAALLDIAAHDGWLPDAHIAGSYAFMQGGSWADVVLAEAVQKGIPGVDAGQALRWTTVNAEEPSPDPLVKGRLYREDYEALGYIPADRHWHPVSRHLEYTYQDWCISRIAAALAAAAWARGDDPAAAGYEELESAYLDRARRAWNLWHDGAGAFIPRARDGAWPADYDPWNEADPAVYEGSVIVWSFNVLHDLHGLIARLGGPERFIRRLDDLFDTTFARGPMRFVKDLERAEGPAERVFVQRRERYFEVKETRMHIPHLYTYAGRPDRAADRVRESLEQFGTGAYGLPDNEDMGCQSGYYLWNSMGLYPIYGQTHYMLVPPRFDRVAIRLSPGLRLNDAARLEDVSPPGDDPQLVITADRTRGERYIVAATLNGAPLDRAWVEHAEIAAGARIDLVLADEPGDWGTRELPPNGMEIAS